MKAPKTLEELKVEIGSSILRDSLVAFGASAMADGVVERAPREHHIEAADNLLLMVPLDVRNDIKLTAERALSEEPDQDKVVMSLISDMVARPRMMAWFSKAPQYLSELMRSLAELSDEDRRDALTALRDYAS